jgi:methylsterol monooxygenase
MHYFPSLYKYHKKHHEFHDVSILAAGYIDPIDFVLSLSVPLIVAMVILNPHTFIGWQVAFANQLHFMYEHGGYAPDDHRWGFLFSPFPLSRNSRHHSLHHSKNTGNYGGQYTVFDRIFGTLVDSDK